MRTILMVFWSGLATGMAAASPAAESPVFPRFDVVDVAEPDPDAAVVEPWKSVPLDPEYSGYWVVVGDLTGDGNVEVVSARNVDRDDVHYTSAVVAQRLDGSVLWRWGDPTVGRRALHHDVACQIHDWDGDGRNEVILCTKGALVELDGATGEERDRWPIADDATDCLVFADLSGKGRPTDVLVKTRYRRIWAYDQRGELLWDVTDPGGFRTAHQPRPIDIDGDGRDEIMAGYSLLNPDGTVRWTFRSAAVDQRSGHLDCCRVLRRGRTPEEWRLVLTLCGANCLSVVDGNGQVQWEIPGFHFESVNVGRIVPGRDALQIAVDVDHQPRGQSPIWMVDETGEPLGRITTQYSRHHSLVDWTGDGWHELVNCHSRGIYDHTGRRIATLAAGEPPLLLLQGDMTGDGIPDLALVTESTLHIYRNERGSKPSEPVALGTGLNFTLY